MEYLNVVGSANWMNIVAMIFLVLCFYFTLMYFQYLREADERLIKQTRLVAVICLAIALLAPAFYNFYMLDKMLG